MELPSDQRAGFCVRECPDAELRAELKELLHASEDVEDSFLDAAVLATPPDPTDPEDPMAPVEARRPEQIGPYRILECLGEGGMGVVYLAEQADPVRRRVALKIVKPGMATRSVLRRFEGERQALARMGHRHIAQVYDAGMDDSGRPYFVMEYVDGAAIHQFCDRERLSVRGRVALMITVCRAVQYAHQRGILHRDLKPSNILVAMDGEIPVPKIIDFGIAKALDDQQADLSGHTQPGLVVGTLDYMSPEQGGATDQIDTRSDVYSLGVVLYELLVGELPLDVRGCSPGDSWRVLAEETPQRPSLRAERSSEEHAVSRRSLRAIELQRTLRGDLDWICMKVLEKEPDLRYHSPRELAKDLQRFLRHEPVLAGPPGTWYRARKLVRRYRLQAIAVAIVVLALILGIVASSHFYLEERDRAREAARLASQLSQEKDSLRGRNADLRSAEQAARLQGQRADANYRSARTNLELANERLGDFNATANIRKTADLKAEEPLLWPARPTLLDHLTGWRDRAIEVIGAEGEVAQVLRRLERRATDASRDDQRGTDPGESVASPDEPSEPVSSPTADATNWLYAQLTSFSVDLKHLEDDLLPSIEKRIDRARVIVQRTVEDVAEEWEDAIFFIAESEIYAGLEITPQMGLVPLGEDADSELWEFWYWETGERPARDEETGRLIVTAETGIVLVLIPGGTFLMGSQASDPGGPNFDPDHRSDETLHEVTLDAYFLSKYELTQGQWERIMGKGTNPSYFSASDASVGESWPVHPVDFVSWTDCHAALSRVGLELPTEAQWERAARAGTDTPWSSGRDLDALIESANLADQSHVRVVSAPIPQPGWDDDYPVHAPVGSFMPNPFGLHDVHGNMHEWCRDWDAYYSIGHRPGDGELDTPWDGTNRVMRGGNFQYEPYHARSAFRAKGNPAFRQFGLSCRPGKAVVTD